MNDFTPKLPLLNVLKC